MHSLEQLESELKTFIIRTLALEDISPEDIAADAPLFGDGLGLDSIDALELGVALHKHYKVKINPKLEETREHFSSVRSLTTFVAASIAAQQAPGETSAVSDNKDAKE